MPKPEPSPKPNLTSIHQLQDFPLHIKWPNDVYYKRERKLAGVLVIDSSEEKVEDEDHLNCIVAAGINVNNPKPTGCINDLLPAEWNIRLSVEEVVAETINQFERETSLDIEDPKLSP